MPQPDPMARYFAGSIGLHAAVLALLIFSGLLSFSRKNWGEEHSSSGSVGVIAVKSIPVPHEEAPENPLANDTDSNVPQAPAPVKIQKEVKAPEPKAIPIPEKVKPKVSPKEQSKAVFRPAQVYKPSQVFSQTPQAASSKMYATQGAAGVDIGQASVLGDRCGAYATVMRNIIAAKWNTADVRALPTQKSAVTFTIGRNGSVSNIRVTQPSGSLLLDTSAQRAVTDANPLPALTAPCDRNDATVELWFQLNK